MKKQKLIIAVMLMLFCPIPGRAFELSLLGGLNYAAPTDQRSQTSQKWTGNAALQFGLASSFDLFDTRFSLEPGLYFQAGESESSSSVGKSTLSTQFTHIPLIVHFFLDNWVSIGAGPYLSFARIKNPVSNQSTDQGLVFDLRARFHVLNRMNLILDARYQHGLKNLNGIPGDQFNTRSIQIMGGVSFAISFPSEPEAPSSPL